MDVRNIARQQIEYMIAMRRYFHEYPELSGKEENTFRKVTNELEKFNIKYDRVGNYGIVGVLHGNDVGKTVLLRADMDALPIEECEYNIHAKRNIISKKSGVSHMCGHDCHMAIMLTVAKILSSRINCFKGRIIFCFESGEENGSGVDEIIEYIKDYKIDAIWALHVSSDLLTKKISVDSGVRMSGSSKFDVTVVGKGGHGSRPDQTIDPINCVVQILSNLSSITSRLVDPRESLVLTIGKLQAGHVGNIIPESASFAGTIRYFNYKEETKAKEAFYRIVNNVAAANGCSVEIKYDGPKPPVINDEKISRIAQESVKKSLGKEFLIHMEPWMASDTIGRYTSRYPGVYVFLGIKNEELGTGAPHHNPNFDVDEDSLLVGAIATIQFIMDFLN